MIDAGIAALQDEITARGNELYGWRVPGFEPIHDDIRTPPSSVPAPVPSNVTRGAMCVVAAPQGSRFVTLDAQGQYRYTRNGALTIVDGTVMTLEHRPLLGYMPGATTIGRLRLPMLDRIITPRQQLHVARDGSVSYDREVLDPRSGLQQIQRQRLGVIALARFPAGSEPVSLGTYERAPLGIEPYIATPGTHGFEELLPDRLDRGGIDLQRALLHLQTAYERFDALLAERDIAQKNLGTAMDLVK